ncbi:hypothetical protein IWW38_005759, partial [Coemansia aciculifera]
MGLKRMGAAQTRVAAATQEEEEDGGSTSHHISHTLTARSRRSIVVDEDDKVVQASEAEHVQMTATETEGEEEEDEATTRRRSHGRAQRQQRGVAEASCGYASSPSTGSRRRGLLRRGHADSLHRPSSLRQQLGEESPAEQHSDSDTIGRPARRKLAPLLVDTHDLESPMTSPPPPIIDKLREERSYREFFPDLITCLGLPVVLNRESVAELTPTTLNADDVDRRLENDLSVGTSPLSDVSSVAALATSSSSSLGGERPSAPSRASSSLSIKLIFNDPESPAQRLPKPLPPQSPLAGFVVPLRSAGKSAQS